MWFRPDENRTLIAHINVGSDVAYRDALLADLAPRAAIVALSESDIDPARPPGCMAGFRYVSGKWQRQGLFLALSFEMTRGQELVDLDVAGGVWILIVAGRFRGRGIAVASVHLPPKLAKKGGARQAMCDAIREAAVGRDLLLCGDFNKLVSRRSRAEVLQEFGKKGPGSKRGIPRR